MNNCYVYATYGMFGETLYIGKGKKDRYKHYNSGIYYLQLKHYSRTIPSTRFNLLIVFNNLL